MILRVQCSCGHKGWYVGGGVVVCNGCHKFTSYWQFFSLQEKAFAECKAAGETEWLLVI